MNAAPIKYSKFVVIEGIDAAGKATQAKLLADKLDAKLFSFPAYNDPFGPEILGHLKKEWRVEPVDRGRLDAMVFQALQLANKILVEPTILDEFFLENRSVVLDRYWPSACIYAPEDGFDDTDMIERMHTSLMHPDIFILLDVDIDTAVSRLSARARAKDRYETQPRSTVENRITRYREFWRAKMAKAEDIGGARWVVVDGTKSVNEVHQSILGVLP